MADTILAAHRILGTAVPLLGTAVVIKGLYGWFARDFFTRSDQVLGRVFTALLDLNLLAGLVLLVRGVVPGGAHLFIMLGVVFAAHGSRLLARRKEAGERHIHQAMEALAITVLVLIFGVLYY
ncbi:MAG: hypothetical protein R6W82_11910 [bacterium]